MAGRRGGFALVTVILVLAALLVLCTPFLLTARNADRASAQMFDRRQAEVALDAAVVHARAVLERSHFGQDPSPYADSLAEITVSNEFPPDFLDASDERGVMWDLDVADLAGLIDLNSAPPQLLASMLGALSRVIQPVTADDKKIPLVSTEGFAATGFVWIEGELIHYDALEGNVLVGLERGLGAQADGDGNPLPGPRPPSNHGVGAPVLDQRAFGPALWRLRGGDVQSFDSSEQLREADDFVLAQGGVGADGLARLAELGSVYGGVRAGWRWQRAARVTSAAQAGRTGHLKVDSLRWFNEGATVRVSDGLTTEEAIVQSVSGGGDVVLDRALTNDYRAYQAIVFVLARRPVNVNTAPPEVLELLFTNLQVRGRNSRITGSEARALAEVVAASRPFSGLEDFLRRVVLPAAGMEKLPEDADVKPQQLADGAAIIDPWDAVALYLNALNANDVSLSFSTMPFCFATRDTYALDLRSTVNAESGVERFSLAREQVELVVPQVELMHLVARQVDFDEALRLNRRAPYWQTGPEPTSRFDPAGAYPPSRAWSHLGTYEGRPFLPGVNAPLPSPDNPEDQPVPEHVFASEEPDGWAQLWAARTDEMGQRAGRAIHFDHEARQLEGRWLPDQTVARTTDSNQVQWTGTSGLMRAMSFQAWIMPRALADGVLLDVGGTSLEADRLSLLLEGEDLVLRALDAGGDHLQSAFAERAELRYALAPGEGPGLPLDTWSHVEIDFRGTRPSQMTLRVDGMTHGVRTPGLTRLTQGVSSESAVLPVESIEGFPPSGVARLGNELVEFTLDAGALACQYVETGPNAGFGGRNARVQWTGAEPPLPANIGLIEVDHPAGTTVELYGYSLPLASDVPSGSASLPSELGPFRVAVATAVEGGRETLGDPIVIQGAFGPFMLGYGMDGQGSEVTGLVLAPAEDPDGGADATDVMRAFNPSGGYAAIVQVRIGAPTLGGSPVGGWEVVQYSGWNGDVLQLAARGGALNLQDLAGADPADGGGSRAFVTSWLVTVDGRPAQQILNWRTFVFPISLPVPGASDLSFLAAQAGSPQFAQITRPDQGDLTEWVCYDWFDTSAGQLLRDDPNALNAAYAVLTSELRWRDIDEEPPDFPPPGPPPPPPGAAPRPSAGAPALGSQWQPILGAAEDDELPIARAVREVFLHRGVYGTYSHSHPAGARVLPVFRVNDRGPDGGRPGRDDQAFLIGANWDHIGWPVRVHRGHRPSATVTAHGWRQEDPALPVASPGSSGQIANVGNSGLIYVALDGTPPEPMVAGTLAPSGQLGILDTRSMTRIALFPSGERPRLVGEVAIGAGFRPGAGAIPSLVVDEIVFGHTDFGMRTPLVDPEDTQGGQLLLRESFSESDERIEVWPKNLRIPLGSIGSTFEFLNDLEVDAGLLRIGDEILAYDGFDASDGTLTVAVEGRGLLGTRPQPHAAGESLSFLEGVTVSVLSAGIGAGDASLPLKDTSEFPPEGTVLIGEELIHTTRLRASALEMPRASTVPGERNERGDGIFRGRYGTTPGAHGAGQPVILFPFRYWDRWADRADAPELSCFDFELEQPAAWWRSFFWIDEEPAHGAVDVGMLVRTDAGVPWDEEPDRVAGLTLVRRGLEDGQPIAIGAQADRVEWRAFVEYRSGAFDYRTGLSHAWKTTPRLRQFGAFYLGPGMTLRSVLR